jgi:molybdenum cofactor cytidylyltransferase
MVVGAIVLAAGASLRMRSPKALLKIGEETFIQHIAGQLYRAGLNDVVIVLGADVDEIRNSLSWFGGTVVVNGDWKEGQLTSVIAGLNALSHRRLDGVLVCPVDRPLITQTVIKGLLKAFQESGKSIVVPVFQGRRGHPTIFSSALFDELLVAPLNVGARHVVWNHPHDVYELASSEEGVLINIDMPMDYEEHILSKLAT